MAHVAAAARGTCLAGLAPSKARLGLEVADRDASGDRGVSRDLPLRVAARSGHPPAAAPGGSGRPRASSLCAARSALVIFALTAVLAFSILSWDVIVADPAAAPTDLLRIVLTTANMFWHVTIAPVFLAGFVVFLRRANRE